MNAYMGWESAPGIHGILMAFIRFMIGLGPSAMAIAAQFDLHHSMQTEFKVHSPKAIVINIDESETGP